MAGLDQLTDEDREIVRRLPLFASLPPEALAKLLEGARINEYAKGDVLFRRDDPAHNFYVVLAGWVKLYRATEDGEEAVIHVFTRGDSVAEAAAFLGREFPASAEIAEPARVLHIPTATFLNELRSTPAIAINMLASMSRHLHQLVMEVEQLKDRKSVV